MKKLKIIAFIFILLLGFSCRNVVEHIKEVQKQSNESSESKIFVEFPFENNKNIVTKTDVQPLPEIVVSEEHEFFSKKWNVTLDKNKDINLIKEIDKWIGTPYRSGGTTSQGMDCSGFVNEVFKNVYNIDLHRRSVDIWQNSMPVKLQDLKFGDLVFFKINFKQISHVGIYINESMFAHASRTRGVVIESMNLKYWTDRFDRGGRILIKE